jgi:16S rRNA (adenine1518-N6/adenine1519-N6)-dimethyltransferase
MSHQPRKRFGQHFLHDPGVVRRIVASIAPQPGDHLVEIGPGEGAITLELLRAAGRLDAIELDRDLVAPLRERARGIGELVVHGADALRFDFCALAAAGEKLRVVGNLPYNISTPLLFHLLDQSGCVRDMHFMLQKEVVERMAAEPGGRDYGRLSVMLQARCEVIPLFTVGPGAFRPPPKVDSAIVRLLPRARPAEVADPSVFARLVAAAFAQRRKTLRNGLKGLLAAEDIAALGIDPGVRAEQLPLEDFVRLANAACKAASQPRDNPPASVSLRRRTEE